MSRRVRKRRDLICTCVLDLNGFFYLIFSMHLLRDFGFSYLATGFEFLCGLHCPMRNGRKDATSASGLCKVEI